MWLSTEKCISMSHLPFMVLKRRIPSAGPQIWIRSSLLILSRSAPATAVEHLFCFLPAQKYSAVFLSHSAVCLLSPIVQLFHGSKCVVIFTPVTWEAGEEPWERWEPVTVQPLLSVLQRGWWQKVLHVKKKKSPWNEYSSTASTVSK